MALNQFSYSLVIGAASACFLVLLLLFPAQALEASLKGISIWWDVLFPALFPFFVVSEMMLGLGLVHFFGKLFDPIMRPVFRIPGIGGFVLAMGFAAGYPVGARLTSQLWEQKLIDREEGERLVAFTTTSDPIFLIGAVSVGFFHDASLAIILAAAHYGTALIVGLLMRFHGKPTDTKTPSTKLRRRLRSWGYEAFAAMHAARLQDGRTLGQMLNQAIRSSIQLVMVIGGLVVFFSVLMELLASAQLMPILYAGIHTLLQPLGLPYELAPALTGGFFEVTIGARAAGGAESSISLMHKTATAAFILSWAGLSVHAQIISLLHQTNLRYLPFCIARLLHGLLAALAVWILWEPLRSGGGTSAAAFLHEINIPTAVPSLWSYMVIWNTTALISLLLALSLFYAMYHAVKQGMKWLK